MVLNLEEDNVGVALLGKFDAVREGDVGPAHRPHRRGAGRRGAARPRGQRDRRARSTAASRSSATRRRQVEIKAPGIISRKSVHEPTADRHQGHRLDDPDRPRPARADHRRPQTSARPRSPSTRSSTRRGRTCSASTWPSARSSPRSPPSSTGSTKAGAMEYTTVVDRRRLRAGAAAVHRAVHRRHHGRVLPRHRPPRPDRLRRPLQAGRRVPPALAPAAPPAGPRSVPGRRVLHPQPPARARRQDVRQGRRRLARRRCRSSRPRPATSRRTSRPTSSRSPTARSSSRPTCSTRASAPPSTSASAVSRVGGAAQTKAMKKIAGRAAPRARAATARRRRSRSSAPTSTRPRTQQLDRGERLVELLKQGAVPADADRASRSS